MREHILAEERSMSHGAYEVLQLMCIAVVIVGAFAVGHGHTFGIWMGAAGALVAITSYFWRQRS